MGPAKAPASVSIVPRQETLTPSPKSFGQAPKPWYCQQQSPARTCGALVRQRNGADVKHFPVAGQVARLAARPRRHLRAGRLTHH